MNKIESPFMGDVSVQAEVTQCMNNAINQAKQNGFVESKLTASAVANLSKKIQEANELIAQFIAIAPIDKRSMLLEHTKVKTLEVMQSSLEESQIKYDNIEEFNNLKIIIGSLVSNMRTSLDNSHIKDERYKIIFIPTIVLLVAMNIFPTSDDEENEMKKEETKKLISDFADQVNAHIKNN